MTKDLQPALRKIIPALIADFFSKGEKRTILLKRNVLGAFMLRGVDTLLGFVRVPLIISFLSVSEYGIWLTLSSVIGWFVFFDVGLSSGLKTKLGIALGKKEYQLAKTYVSTTYATIAIIIGLVFLIFILIYPFLDWGKILNVPSNLSSSAPLFVLVFTSLFAFQFIANIIGTILTADQRPTAASAISTLTSIIYLLLLILLKTFTKGTLLSLTLICNGTSVIIYLAASIYLFRGRYFHISPSFKAVDFSHFKELATLGIKFFFIQISSIILFSTDNMIITQLYTPADVAPYSVSMKYMTIPLMLFSMVTWPLWAAFSEAYAIKDYEWIRKTVNKLVLIWFGMILLVLICLLFAELFYQIWLKGEIIVPFLLSAFMGLYALLVGWNQIFVFFLNGVGKIKLQLYMSFITIFINIPMSVYFAKGLGLGPAGVILATNVCIFIGSVWAPIQYRKIINGEARGIWDQ